MHAPSDTDVPDTAARRTVLVVMCVGYFLVLLDVTVVNTALPAIGGGLGGGLSALQWVVDGYTIALAACMLAAGTLGDRYGHKRLVLVGLAVLTVASAGCTVAPTVLVLNVFRVLQGIGAALLLPATLAVITHAYPEPREQARAIGAWAGIGSSALVLGPLLGGLLTEAIGWRAVFAFNIPIGLVVLPVAARVVRESRSARAGRFDLPGVVLGAAVLGTATFAVIQAGNTGADTTTVTAAVAAVVLLAGFVAVERTRQQPMLPLRLLRNRQFVTANAVAGAMNLGTVGLLFVLNLYLQEKLGYGALGAGLALLPLYLPLCGLAPVGGRLVARIGPRLPMTVGMLGTAAGVALLLRLDDSSGFAALLPALLLWGIGLGLLTPAVVTAAVDAVPADSAGLASAVNNTARQAAQAMGIAVFGALAGEPATAGFLAGFHTTALLAAGLFLVSAVAAAGFSGSSNHRPRDSTRR